MAFNECIILIVSRHFFFPEPSFFVIQDKFFRYLNAVTSEVYPAKMTAEIWATVIFLYVYHNSRCIVFENEMLLKISVDQLQTLQR